MKLAELRAHIETLTEFPGDMDVVFIAKNGAVKPIDSIRWTPLAGGIAAFEKDPSK